MTSSSRLFLVITIAACSALPALACGASLNAVYEGDVRFEHCMALDERPDANPAARTSCWKDWVKYYTFGQTRDRVDYARRRQRQLSGASETDATTGAQAALAQRVVPEPTTVLAPPPMLIADAGRAPEDAGASNKPPAPEPPAAACAALCGDTWAATKQACTNAACEKTAATTYRRCMKRCF